MCAGAAAALWLINNIAVQGTVPSTFVMQCSGNIIPSVPSVRRRYHTRYLLFHSYEGITRYDIIYTRV